MKNFLKTVATVTVFSVCEKFLGFLYRIYMSRSIGAEGIGMYQVALSVFALLLTVSCSGTPITVSRLMTKYKAENKPLKVKRIISSGLFLTLLCTVLISLIFVIFGRKFTFLFADERCYDIFLVILPGLVFTSVYAVLRGVFWGNKDFIPYSVIELLEEICMIISGVILISHAKTVFDGAFRAGIAVTISYLCSFSLAVIVFFLRKNKLANPIPELKPLIASAAPVTAMRTANSLVTSLISILLPLRLISSGLTESQAMSTFGAAVGQAMPILFIPTTFIGSFTLVLVQEISENFYKKRDFYLKRDVEKAIKFGSLITCLFIPLFTVCGEEIGILIFDSPECGKYLSASAFLTVFMTLSTITTSILNSIGLENKTLLYFIISSLCMLAAIWFLPQVIGIYALLVGFTLVYGVTTVLNFFLLSKNCKLKPQYTKFLFKITGTCIPSILFGLMLEKMLLPVLGIFFTFLVCSTLILIFHSALIVSLNIVSIDFIKIKLKSNFSIKRKKSEA